MRRPLSVVATDQEALRALLSLHAPPEPRILDVTANRGRFWRGLPYKPHRLDRDPVLFDEGFTDTIADFRALPFGPDEFDVIVFDPPHIPEAGDAMGVSMAHEKTPWTVRYGLGGNDLGTSDVSGLFPPFLSEAQRVLSHDGIVLAKIADQIHRGAYRWQHIDLILAGRLAGFTPCDMMVKVTWSRGSLQDPKWRRIYHVRGVHTYWLVLRKGNHCVSPTAPRVEREQMEAMFA